jgi:DNA replication protein DnaC
MWLSATEEAYADRQLRLYGIAQDRCPTCGLPLNPAKMTPEQLEVWEITDHDCGKEAARIFRYAGSGLAKRDWEFDWSTARPNALTNMVERYLANFDENVKAGVGFTVIAKSYGNGKTLAMTQVAKHAIDHGYSARMVNFQDVTTAFRSDDLSLEDRWALADVFCVDEMLTPQSEAQAALFERVAYVIDIRYGAQLPTFIGGNLSYEELRRSYPKVESRLAAASELVQVPTTDYRHLGRAG